MPDYSYSDPVVLAFVVIPVILASAFVLAVFAACRRSGHRHAERAAGATAAAAGAWMAMTWVAADSGILREWNRTPPPFGVLVLAIVALSLTIAFSDLGRRLAHFLPLWLLVGVQGFRLPLELAMHGTYERGIMPGIMSYSGRNFDILTGASAIIVAALLFAGHAGRRLAVVWNVLGLALVLNVVIVAIMATPRFRYFGDENLNVWVTYPPFVWLPAVMVLAALAGHFIVFRAIAQERT